LQASTLTLDLVFIRCLHRFKSHTNVFVSCATPRYSPALEFPAHLIRPPSLKAHLYISMKSIALFKSLSPRTSGGGALASPRASGGGSSQAVTAMPPLRMQDNEIATSLQFLSQLIAKPIQLPKSSMPITASKSKSLFSTTSRQANASSTHKSHLSSSKKQQVPSVDTPRPTVPRFSRSILATTEGRTNPSLLADAKELLGLSPRPSRHSLDGSKLQGQSIKQFGSSGSLTADPPKITNGSKILKDRSSAPAFM
jgi:hypothetical protein